MNMNDPYEFEFEISELQNLRPHSPALDWDEIRQKGSVRSAEPFPSPVATATQRTPVHYLVHWGGGALVGSLITIFAMQPSASPGLLEKAPAVEARPSPQPKIAMQRPSANGPVPLRLFDPASQLQILQEFGPSLGIDLKFTESRSRPSSQENDEKHFSAGKIK